MRTTVNLADDVAAAIEKLRRERSLGLSEAVNELIRGGLSREAPADPYEPQPQDIGLSIDVTNVAEAIETLDGPAAR